MFVEYTFFPVGQGLFSCGKLYTDKNKKPFVWIYDCGTLKGDEDKLTTAIDELNDIDEFDLVVISHFHTDHINGLKKLLANKPIKKLMMPFLTDEQKGIAFIKSFFYWHEQQSKYYYINDNLFEEFEEFLYNPLNFIEKNKTFDNSLELNLVLQSELSKNIRVPEIKNVTNVDEHNICIEHTQLTTKANITVMEMAANTLIVVDDKWEFLLYNDTEDILIENNDEIKEIFQEIDILKEKIKSSCYNKKEKEKAINDLKKKHSTLLASITNTNSSSIFMYAGCHRLEKIQKCYSCKYNSIEKRHGILYTGDGDLSNSHKVDILASYLEQERVNNIHCLQVMHHGSKHNNCPEVAKKFQPLKSIFSANPKFTYKHPHKEVLLDFINNGPVLVSEVLRYPFVFSESHFFPFKKSCPFYLSMKYRK